MIINWINEDEYYHFDLKNGFNKRDSIKQLISKIIQLSSDKKDWNSIILDKWIFNLGRLIGNIQNDNEPVGSDRGYRVALKFEEYDEGLKSKENSAKEYDECIDFYNENLEILILEVLNEEEFKKELNPIYLKHPFVIEICERGQRKGIKIDINKK